MPEEPKPAPEGAVQSTPPENPPAEQNIEEIGDFITRHVLEKDSVFFEG